MPENAKPRDVQAGWAVFRHSGYKLTLDEINKTLKERGFNPISARTYAHYRKLARYGYERYVPINQLDVETLRDPVWDTPLRHRYLVRSSDQAVTLVFVRGDVLFVPGRIESISELEAVIRVANSHLDAIGKSGGASLENEHGLAVVGAEPHARSIVVEAVQQSDDPSSSLIFVGFPEVVSPGTVGALEPLPRATIEFTLQVDDSQYFLNSVRALNGLVAAFESVRIACDEGLRQLGVDNRYFLSPPEVTTLERRNPIHVTLEGACVVVAVFTWVLTRILNLRQQWHHGSVTAGSAEVNEATAELIRQNANLVGQQAALVGEYVKKEQVKTNVLERLAADDYKEMAAVIVSEVAKALPAGSGDSEEHKPVEGIGKTEPNTDRLEALIQRQLLPGVEKLLDSPVRNVDFSTDVSAPDAPLGPQPDAA